MACRGHVRSGVVVLDEPRGLPEGAEVIVELVAPAKCGPDSPRRRDWKGIYESTGPVPSEADITEMRRETWHARPESSEPCPLQSGTSWLTDDRLRAVCEILAGYAGYDFGEEDWDAIQ